MSKKNRTERLLINVPKETQEGVRLLALLSGTTINELVNRILNKEIAANRDAIEKMQAVQNQYKASLIDCSAADKGEGSN